MTKFIGIGIIETVNKERNAFYLLLIFIICFVVEKLQRNFVLLIATYLEGLKEGSNSQELQSKLTIGMAFQFDLYLTD